MHPPLNFHKHPMCTDIIEQFQKCHLDHPISKFFGECNDLKVKLDRCFRQERLSRRKQNFEKSKKFKERLWADRLREKEEEHAKAGNFHPYLPLDHEQYDHKKF